MSGGNEHKEISKAQREVRDTKIRQGTVAYVEKHTEDFEGFLVNQKTTQQLGTLEGERQRTVKEWCTFMGQPTEYGDNILSQFVSVSVSVCVNERERHENEKESDNTDVTSTCTLREY